MNTFHKTLIAIAVSICLLTAGQLLLSSVEKEDPITDASFHKHFNNNYKIYALTLPDEMNFSGEAVPLELLDVREKLDRELLINTYWQSQTMLFHKRANRYFPVIEPILKANGVPDDFKYLSLIESGFQNVVSPAGATGFWQFMPHTATEYGLEVDGEVDERYHLEKSTEAACKYLNAAYARYGSWTMAAASYNLGMNGINRQIERQNVRNYYDMLLVEETARYVFRILAAKEILTNPVKYGFHFREKDLYPPYKTYSVTIDSSVADFSSFAAEHGINYKILKTLNPWLRDTYLKNPGGKTYDIKLPEKGFEGLIPAEDFNNAPEPLLTDSI